MAMSLSYRVNKIKWEFFNELKRKLSRYDLNRVRFDEDYEIDSETDAMLDELLDYSQDWFDEFWTWVTNNYGFGFGGKNVR